jgi:hypothetical protein
MAEAMSAPMAQSPAGAVTVPIKAPWQSKINMVQGLGVLVYVLDFVSHLDPGQKAAFATVYGLVHCLVTGLLRTKFNYSVTPGDVFKAALAARAALRK